MDSAMRVWLGIPHDRVQTESLLDRFYEFSRHPDGMLAELLIGEITVENNKALAEQSQAAALQDEEDREEREQTPDHSEAKQASEEGFD
jgi:hypothetical protein